MATVTVAMEATVTGGMGAIGTVATVEVTAVVTVEVTVVVIVVVPPPRVVSLGSRLGASGLVLMLGGVNRLPQPLPFST